MTTTAAPTATVAPGATALPGGTSPARQPVSRRRRITRRVVGGLVLLALLVVASVLPEPRTSSDPLAPDSTAGHGSRAVAQILGRNGVDVRHVSRLDEAVAQATAGRTLFVTDHGVLWEEHVERLAATGADLVLVNPGYLVEYYAPDVVDAFSWGQSSEALDAACTDPDALAAGTLVWAGGGFAAEGDSVTLCFLAEDGAGGMAVTQVDGRRVTALATREPFTNDALTTDGNAALALRLLGRNAELVWYTPDARDLLEVQPGEARAGLGELLPSWAGVVLVQLVVLVVFIALWRGRRLGRLVTEPLPVVVQSAETTRGRGRLYRRSRAYGHAGASLRAATASRCAVRLGLPRSADAQPVIDEVSYASGRPRDEVAALLYGPPPASDAALTDLARELDRLESEVNRP